jgi:hypothetical protein
MQGLWVGHRNVSRAANGIGGQCFTLGSDDLRSLLPFGFGRLGIGPVTIGVLQRTCKLRLISACRVRRKLTR